MPVKPQPVACASRFSRSRSDGRLRPHARPRANALSAMSADAAPPRSRPSG
ncbi:MAG: hypothetical protein AVDCRST_MAG27-2823 [uncultured Craurococcus sp.]|uniref:Uncharacterized protein n=1 Tax=uncultured Craurococcus sp. TaxID=1135998 RepID=A0A6J4IZD3_9PROT|nr:MAG: hypothetical protein AVDCRST_MAG27-2823 [uncultured Craurococcus sp.]